MARNPDREPVFRFKRFEVRNASSAMKVGTDGVLLGAWFDMSPGAKVLDVGTGCGVIGLMAAQRGAAHVTAVEIDAAAADEAAYNVSVSPWNERMTVVHADFRTFDAYGGRYDRIVSNPPFFKETTLSPDQSRAMARHEGTLTLTALLDKAASLLNPAGRVALVIPVPRLDDALYAAAMVRLYPVRVHRVVTRQGKPPSRVLMEFGPDAVPVVEQAVLGMDSVRYQELVSPFYLDRK